MHSSGMTKKSWTAKGSCLCGKVQFTLWKSDVAKVFKSVAHCHCCMCRKHTGSAFSTFGEVPIEAIEFKNGEINLKRYKAPENNTIRTFCSNCGSNIMFESPYNRIDRTTELAVALVDEFAEGVTYAKPDCHIYTKYKAPWFDIQDLLPQYEEYRK